MTVLQQKQIEIALATPGGFAILSLRTGKLHGVFPALSSAIAEARRLHARGSAVKIAAIGGKK